MQSSATTSETNSVVCWGEPEHPWDELLAGVKSGPFAAARASGDQAVEELVARLRRESPGKPAIFVGAGTCGMGAGAGATIEAVRAYCDEHTLDADIVEVGCVGLCALEPIMDVQLPGRARVSFGNVVAEEAPAILDAVFGERIPEEHVLGQYRDPHAVAWDGIPTMDEHSFFSKQRRVVLAGSGIIDPTSIDEYIARGGYSAAARALRTITPEELCELVESSGLRGRGGGGFPTGKKWKFALNAASEQKYLICNADEGDPGAFMDRAVCESDPHRLLEGIIIASYAIGATRAYIYLRAEYPLAVERMTQAIEQARLYGLLGENILDSDNKLEVVIKMGAGAFVCGEETALIHSIEGKRGMPRPRPPFPAVKGLFDKPTIINNVETLANLALIVARGPEWFSSMGTEGSKGTKVFALSGMVRNTGLVEIPMGTTLREVVFDVGGGVSGSRPCKAVQIGGPSGGCIPEAKLDLPTDYEALKEFGAIMGSGGLVVLDEGTCMVDLAKFFMEFVQQESCGKCIPCREGTKRMLEILESITRNRHSEDDNDALLRFRGVMMLKELAETIRSSSLCGLGQTAPNPVLSTLRWFRDEYEAHVFDRSCPAGVCKELVGAPCQTGCPVGTEVWRYVAHVARGEYAEAYRVIRAANPFPSVCARVCHHPCEDNCRAGSTGGEPVAVRALKRFVVERVDPSVYQPVVQPASTDAIRIAVIGGGPAGLTAAHNLSLSGHRVTVFERESELGGMLVSAIPSYRLPRDKVREEIKALLNDNIEVKLDTELGRDITVDGLLESGYKAVYLAMGSHESRKLGISGEDATGVVTGMEFLKAYNLKETVLATGKVGIIGGGNSAIDAARVAMRQEGVEEVTVFYRRTRNEMPAYTEEIVEALAEGVKIEELTAPVEVLTEDGRLTGMSMQRNKLGEPDADGRRRPEPVQGSEFEVTLDSLIVAISERPETAAIPDLRLTSYGTLETHPETHMSNKPGVFGGGDLVTGSSSVVGASAAGEEAAMMIDRFVTGKRMTKLGGTVMPSVYVAPVPGTEDTDVPAARVAPPLLPVEERKRSFAEVELCLSEEAAQCEARRCLRCDLEFTQPA